MSIINDALKRAQKNMANKDTKNVKSPPPKTVQKLTKDSTARPAAAPKPKSDSKKKTAAVKKKKMWFRTLAIIVAVFFLITGILIATLFFLKKRASDSDDPNQIRRSYQPRKINRTFKEGELALSGISLIENKRVALINGDIYEEGDIVEGHKIISIELKQVALKDTAGKVVRLRIKKTD